MCDYLPAAIKEAMLEDCARAAIVREARTWLRTPWHHMARVKGAGVDCGMLLAEVFERAGVCARVHVDPYPQDWALHRSEERFLTIVEQFAIRDDWTPVRPGDIFLFRYGRCLSHAAIAIDTEGTIIHAYLEARAVVVDSLKQSGPLLQRLEGKWNPWRKAEQ